MKYYSRLIALLLAVMMFMSNVAMAGGMSVGDLTFAELESMHAQLADRRYTYNGDILGGSCTIEAFKEIIDKTGYTFEWYGDLPMSIGSGYKLTVEYTLETQTYTCALIMDGQVAANQIFTIEPAQTTDLNHYINAIYTDYDYTCIQDVRPLADYFQMAYEWMQKWNVTLADGSNLAANVLKYWYADELTRENPFADPLLCTCYLSDDGQSVTDPAIVKAPHEQHDEECLWHTDSVIIYPPMPDPIPPKDPSKFEQYTSNVKYSLAELGNRAVILPEGGRAVIETGKADGYQWQVFDGTQWVSIQGETGADLAVTTAKLATIFDLTSIAELRYFDKANDVVMASVSVVSQEIAGGEYVEPVEEEAAPALYLIERDGETTASTYTIKVYYYYENTTTPVYREDSATYQAGQPANWTVTYPVLVGYDAWWMGRANDDTDNETDKSTSHTISIDALNENISYVVYYKPANVGFKVLHYLQNLEDDKYAEPIIVKWDGYTNEKVEARLSDKEVLIDSKYDEKGYYALPFSTDGLNVAADGSTEVEIYYDRYYRLMNFELQGGYGVEPIYAKYETPISAGKPDRAGYTFVGWAATADGTADANLPPATMPAEHVTYYAVWQKNANATVTIVHWGENADDEGYSYLEEPSTTITLPSGDKYIYGGASLDCDLGSHQHDDTCTKICTEADHAHTDECSGLTCTITEHTTHTDSCYGNCPYRNHQHSEICRISTQGGQLQVCNGSGHPTRNVKEGDTDTHGSGWGQTSCVYYNGNWYVYTYYGAVNSATCPQAMHTHVDSCRNCTYHAHDDDCYKTCSLHVHTANCYSCKALEHTHNADCFSNDPAYPVTAERNLYKFVRSDVVTVNPDGSTVVNVYWDRVEFMLTFIHNDSTVREIKEKWGAYIYTYFPITNQSTNTVYSKYWWQVTSNSQTLTQGRYILSLDIMPAENITFNSYTRSDPMYLYYYVEALDQKNPASVELNGETYEPVQFTGEALWYSMYKFVSSGKGSTTSITYSEEFHPIEGFTQYKSNPSFGNSDSVRAQTNNYFYYKRNSYALEFHNLKTNVVKSNIPYEMPLGGYDFTPAPADAPSYYEPGSVEFAGWYLNPECTGEQYILSEHTMPAATHNGDTALVLYAKWVPVTYTVNFYLTDALYEAGEIYTPNKTDEFGMPMLYPPATFPVTHGDYIAPEYVEANLDYSAMVRDDPNNPYIFVYWKYWDAETEEWKAFNPTSPVRRNMDLIGVWSSNKLVNYKVTFVDKETGTIIADTISGQALAGSSKFFDAKGGTALYDSTKSENRVNYQSGYFPIVPSHSITMDLLDETKNEFTFYYIKATAVPYTVHYLAETLAPGDISLGTITLKVKDENGTLVDKTYHKICADKTVSDNAESVVTEKYEHVDGYLVDAYQKTLVLSMKEDGAGGYVPNTEKNVIYFFYEVNENSTSYKVIHYKEVPENTLGAFEHDGKYWDIHQDDTKPGEYGKNVAESAVDIPNYTYDPTIEGTKTSGTPNKNADQLVLKFYYTENDALIKYIPVGPSGNQWEGGTAYVNGTTDATEETLKKVTGAADGATAVAADAYKFVGWYTKNADGDYLPVTDAGGKHITSAIFEPQQPGRITNEDGTVMNGVWPTTTTYYAKFDWNMGSLKITKTGLQAGESAIFKVTATPVGATKAQDYYIVLSGPGPVGCNTATITNLAANSNYTVTEQSSWSWSYDSVDEIEGTIVAGGIQTHEIENEKNNQWLHDENGVINDFSKTSGTDVDN